MTFRYRWVGSNHTAIPDAGVEVMEGDEFESPVELNHPHVIRLDDSGDAAPEEPDTPGEPEPPGQPDDASASRRRRAPQE